MSPIVVTGGTGQLGRQVVRALLDAGREAVVLSRRERPVADGSRFVAVDLRTGAGLGEALSGVDTVVHCASTLTGGDEQAAEKLFGAAKRAGVAHLVNVSIVGVDRIPLPYYKTKLAVERQLEASGLGYTTLRATQFHDLIQFFFAILGRSPVVPVPSIRFQPVDTRDVAVRLAELALAEPAGRVPDFGGPEVRDAKSLARAYFTATGRRRLLVPLRMPGQVMAGFRRGENLVGDRFDGRITFEEFLAERATRRPSRFTDAGGSGG
ncbi:SDR family oxidoreductase [Amycolatopsis sp. YIM 10]|uniref:SDR family oxidoreductase n=1 Tax=Amycolatopsis sp. YIM 10 TaxID=2653857 RepID=UPI00128FE253|nr:SDR family oxidoreductase [Amycolatopsis sp. YIM 10]QFU87915.1 NAD(P)H azoreductase [Amycolatopsis sp. YIM 10]